MIQTTWAMPVFDTKAMPRRWFTKPQKDTLRKIYPTAPREAILAEFPHHSWPAIVERARRMQIRRRRIEQAAAQGKLFEPEQPIPQQMEI